ncbi:MAG: hypothetical protein AABM32_04750 [Chloroflexota bacterium]
MQPRAAHNSVCDAQSCPQRDAGKLREIFIGIGRATEKSPSEHSEVESCRAVHPGEDRGGAATEEDRVGEQPFVRILKKRERRRAKRASVNNCIEIVARRFALVWRWGERGREASASLKAQQPISVRREQLQRGHPRGEIERVDAAHEAPQLLGARSLFLAILSTGSARSLRHDQQCCAEVGQR